MVDAGPVVQGLFRRIKNGAQFGGMREQQTLQFIIVSNADEHRKGFAVPLRSVRRRYRGRCAMRAKPTQR